MEAVKSLKSSVSNAINQVVRLKASLRHYKQDWVQTEGLSLLVSRDFTESLSWLVILPFLLLLVYRFGPSQEWRYYSQALFVLWAVWLTVLHPKYDAPTIAKIRIPYAPQQVIDVIKRTTDSAWPVNVFLLKSFPDQRSTLSQTAMVKFANAKGASRTHMRIRDFIRELESQELIAHSKVGQRRQYAYHLTEGRGRWCRKAVDVCFPTVQLFSNLAFHANNGLGLAYLFLPPFPEE
jgi:membrane-bound metal-dependent hydrolase YbcI (DUF457 family)